MKKLLLGAGLIYMQIAFAQTPLITNISGRETISLNGTWQYIVDPYETGFYGYRMQERNSTDRDAYWNSDVPLNKTDKIEYGYNDKYTLQVPGDWNSQDPKFLYYEGTIWYKKSFDFSASTNNKRVYLYFGAVNYKADVYLNGKKLGVHKGGFTPFNFEIPAQQLKPKDNFLVVKVDNKRYADEVPTLNTDWWNYGGITRDVKLVMVPEKFIIDYNVQLDASSLHNKIKTITGWVVMHHAENHDISIQIPELTINQKIKVQANADTQYFSIPVKNVQLWSPKNPKLYSVLFTTPDDKLQDKIGFRTIEVKDDKIFLNGSPLFLRGICAHEEMAREGRRAYSNADAVYLINKAKELHINMMRLAHYPHNENMIRVADSLGVLIWSEIPVYWTIDFSNDTVYQKARAQLQEMITRDRNRASVIIWSVGNETPVNPTRTQFMQHLIAEAKRLDNTRLVSAALETHTTKEGIVIDDPLGAYTDIVAVNEYLGWYSGLPSSCAEAKWIIKYDKPLFFSETGAETLGGFHADSLTRWSEEYQEWFYKEQVAMMKRMPKNYVGLSPWILFDFRSPRRNNPIYQEGWNNKGLYDHVGNKKKAFYVLQHYYEEIERAGNFQ